MDNKIGSIDNDGNMTESNVDDFNSLTTPSESDTTTSYDTSSYSSDFDSKSDDSNEEFDVFGNSTPAKEGFKLNKKLLLIPLLIVLILIIVLVVTLSSNNKYTVSTKKVTIKIDETAQIEVEGKEKVLSKLTYQTDDKKIATVDKKGKITGVSVGTTKIYVGKEGKKEHEIIVKVNTNKEDLILQTTNITVRKDETYQLKIKNVLKTDVFTYSSNNEDVATIDQEGLITGVHGGSTTIVVRESDGRSVSTRVTVESDEVLISNISIDDQTIAIGESITLKPVYEPANSVAIFKYKSSNDKVVEVDEKGVVTGIKDGTATITIESHNGKKDTAKITVDEELAAKITLSGCQSSVAIGTPITLTVNYEPDTANNKVTWTSSNENVATVNSGKVNGKTPGKATITATTPNGKKAVCNVTITPTAVTSLKASTTSVTLDQKDSKKVSVSFEPSSASKYYTVSWKSSNNNIARVDGEGNITAVNPGTATITASAGGKSVKISVTVNATEVTKINLTGCQTTLQAEQSFTMTATASPATAKNATIKWKTSDSSIASVSGGKVTGKGVGTATITAYTSNGTEAKCTVKVTAPPIEKSEMSLTIDGNNVLTTTYKIKLNASKTVKLITNLSSTQMSKYYKVTWTSSNTSVATISASSNTQSATLKGLKKGATTISATVGGHTVSFSVQVTE